MRRHHGNSIMRNIRPIHLGEEEQSPMDPAFEHWRSAIETARQDDGRGALYGRRRMLALRYYLRRLITEQPFIEKRLEGKIIAVDTDLKECTAIIEGEPGPVEHIKYYPPQKKPKIGDKFSVHFEHKLPTRTMEENSRFERGERWIKQYGNRWLYRRERAGENLIRYAWPPPERPTDWNVEIVKESDDLPTNSSLFGSSTNIDEQESTQIVLSDFTGALAIPEGSNATIGSPTAHYYHFKDMGFGDIGREYDVDPLDAFRLMSIANDGINTVSTRNTYGWIELPDTVGYHPEFVLAETIQCCKIQPVTGDNICVTQQNYVPEWIASDVDHQPLNDILFRKHYLGEYGELSQHEVLERPYIIHQIPTDGTSVHVNHYEGSNCEFLNGQILLWTDLVVTLEEYFSPDGVSFPVVIYSGQQPTNIALAGSWNYNNERTDAYVYEVNTYILNNPSLANPQLVLTGMKWVIKCVGANTTEFEMNVFGMNAVDPVGMALAVRENSEETDLIIWWQETPDSGSSRIFKTVGNNPNRIYAPAIQVFVAVSRDGVDVIGRIGQQSYYSVDSGEHWTIMPAVDNDNAPDPRIPFGVKFVDEIA